MVKCHFWNISWLGGNLLACTLTVANGSEMFMYSWGNRFRRCSGWKGRVPCSVYGESSERVEGWTNSPLWKIVEFFVQTKKIWINLHSSRILLVILENYLMIVIPDLQCEPPNFHGLLYFYLSDRFSLPLICALPDTKLSLDVSSCIAVVEEDTK
jgi:hypothetical protein